MSSAEWAARVQSLQGPEMADAIYKKVNEILDERIETHRQVFAEEGTTDWDAQRFIIATQFAQAHLDPGTMAALAIAAIYRLARQHG